MVKLKKITKYLMERQEELSSKLYHTSERYEAGEIIHHPGFGLGRVLKTVGSKRMIVHFYKRKMGNRTLVMNSP